MFEAIIRFRQKLEAGKLCLGPAITMADPLITEALADSVDFVWLDLEHTPMSPEAVKGHMLAARSKGIPAIVRVPGSGTPFIKPFLDAGAEGIVVPQVRSVEEVRQIVDDCRYPPLGRRGYGPRVPGNYGRDGGSEYAIRANQHLFVAVQIETVEAVEAIDGIVAVPGLDSVVLGPWDLTASLGVLGQLDHPKVVAAIETVIASGRAAGLHIGSGMGADPNYAALMARRGVQWIQAGGDYSYLVKYADQFSDAVRQQLAQVGDKSANAPDQPRPR
jgi:2-keto-3-deoxy-L-rhamnonate aldolase RhmA